MLAWPQTMQAHVAQLCCHSSAVGCTVYTLRRLILLGFTTLI